MSVNARQVTIIKLLLKQDRYVPTAELALGAGCSERTVRSDIHAINAFFESEGVGARTTSKRGNGIRLHVTSAQRERIHGTVKERALAVDSALDRFYRGMLLLTCDHNRRYTTDQLARAILTNKQQAQEDLRSWNEQLAPYQAQIVRGRHIAVEGREDYIRFFVVYHLFGLAPTAMKRRIEPQVFCWEGEDTRAFFSEQITRMERALDKPYTDNARHQIAVYLQIMVFRVRRGDVLAGADSPIPAAVDELADNVEERFGVALPASERAIIRDLFAVSARRWTPDFQQSFVPAPDAAGHAIALFAALEQRFGRRPPAHLEKPLAALMQSALTHMRLERSISLPRENTRAVRYENMASYLRLMEVVRDTQGLADLSFYETDYTRIAMLLLSYLDGVTAHDLWRVGLVVNCGIEQVFYARDRIERLIPCTKIARVLTEEELLADPDPTGATLRDLDFLVSFDPIETEMPVAIVSNGLSEVDRIRINALIMQLGCPGQRGGTPFSGGVPTRELDISGHRTLRRELHRALVDDGLWKSPLSGFSTVLEMNSITCEDWMLLTVFSNDVRATGVRRYEVDAEMGFSGQRLNHVLALTVARKDERALTPLTQAFRRIAEASGFPAA